MAVATAGEGGARIRWMRRKAPSLARRVARVPSAFSASRSWQQHSGRDSTSRRNGKSYTHGGYHAQAPSGDVQPCSGPAAHLARSHRSAAFLPLLFRADHARPAAGAAAPALSRDAAMLEVRADCQVYRRSRLSKGRRLGGRPLGTRQRLTVGTEGGADFALRPLLLAFQVFTFGDTCFQSCRRPFQWRSTASS